MNRQRLKINTYFILYRPFSILSSDLQLENWRSFIASLKSFPNITIFSLISAHLSWIHLRNVANKFFDATHNIAKSYKASRKDWSWNTFYTRIFRLGKLFCSSSLVYAPNMFQTRFKWFVWTSFYKVGFINIIYNWACLLKLNLFKLVPIQSYKSIFKGSGAIVSVWS